MSPELEMLLDMSRRVPMTNEQQEAQRRSFVYGNTKIENGHVTREMVAQVAEAMAADGRSR